MDEDLRHLQLLSIFHYIVGGMVFLCYSIPIIHLFIGIGMVTGSFPQGPGQPPPPAAMGWIFIGVAGVIIVLGWSLGVCLCIAGLCLSRQRGYVFCLVIAGLSCLFQPFGTVLGVFTLIVLCRPSVKELFGRDTGGIDSVDVSQ